MNMRQSREQKAKTICHFGNSRFGEGDLFPDGAKCCLREKIAPGDVNIFSYLTIYFISAFLPIKTTRTFTPSKYKSRPTLSPQVYF